MLLFLLPHQSYVRQDESGYAPEKQAEIPNPERSRVRESLPGFQTLTGRCPVVLIQIVVRPIIFFAHVSGDPSIQKQALIRNAFGCKTRHDLSHEQYGLIHLRRFDRVPGQQNLGD